MRSFAFYFIVALWVSKELSLKLRNIRGVALLMVTALQILQMSLLKQLIHKIDFFDVVAL
jgi:predicted membrane protein